MRVCSVKRGHGGGGVRLMSLKADLERGVRNCPSEGQRVKVVTDHPAPNKWGPIAARCCEACVLCGLKPDAYDFTDVSTY